MPAQKGNILVLLLILVVLGAVAAYLLIKSNLLGPPSTTEMPATSRQNTINSKTQYQNPFEASSSSSGYSNPFDTYENPFKNVK